MYFGKFNELSPVAISPTGWLRAHLNVQKDGLTGHIEEAGYPFNTPGWAAPLVEPRAGVCEDWWPYEQTAYWIDGALRCGHLLRDPQLLARSSAQLRYVIENQRADGYLGPENLHGNRPNDIWPHAVMMRALMAEHQATGDAKTFAALRRFAGYFIRRTSTPKAGAERDIFGLGSRDQFNIEHACYTHAIGGDLPEFPDFLTRFCAAQHATRFGFSAIPDGHGVSYVEKLKIPILAYLYANDLRALDIARECFRDLEYYHMLIDGVPGACEELCGQQSNMVHETCVTSDYTWTLGYMLMATGEACWADKIERACFNAGLGAVTKDFKAHQYYSGPNQFVANGNSSHWNADTSWYEQSRPRLAYQPGHDTECCTGNVTRFMPNYAARMWMRDREGGVVAALYGPSQVEATLPGGDTVRIEESTRYPFSGDVLFTIRLEKPTRFRFSLRIPGWCTEAEVTLRGKPISGEVQPGTFVCLHEEFRDGDQVRIHFPLRSRVERLPWNGVAVCRGPLVFSYPIPAERKTRQVPGKGSTAFPAYDLDPASWWAYGLAPARGENSLVARVKEAADTAEGNIWSADSTPVRLEVQAVKLAEWNLDKGHTPVLPGRIVPKGDEMIELIPLGATTLRLSVFPDIHNR